MCFTHECNCPSGNIIFPIKVLSDSFGFQPINIYTGAFNLNMSESVIQPAYPKHTHKNSTTIICVPLLCGWY